MTIHSGGAPAMLLMLLLLTATVTAEESREQCLARAAACIAEDSDRPICGSDAVTYTSRCTLMRAQCNSTATITVKHRGKCRKTQQCLINLEYARKHPSAPGDSNYLPTCKPDGTYTPVQCHKDTGYCWCVNAEGRPVPNSSVRRNGSSKPRCGQRGKSTTRRRSSIRGRGQKRSCSLSDKALFNNNLIDNFHTEWTRINNDEGIHGAALDRVVLEWKFKDMDKNRDGKLDKTEYRDLRKLVKKFVKPKRCSKSFARACDMDRDQQISRQEWADCLTRDGMNVSLRVFLSLNADDKPSGINGDDGDGETDDSSSEKDEDDDDYDDNDQGNDDFLHEGKPPGPPHGMLQNGSMLPSSSNQYDESGEPRDEDFTDCLSDRQAVLNEQRSENMYVPDCTPDGRYQKIQCYKSVGYCWCVHEDTGKNIPGTSVKNATPKCDQMPLPSRPMKGCPEPKKSAFLKDLMEFLHNRMITGTNDTNITGSESGTWQASQEEKAATWNFVVLDKNKNKVLERKEWKAFRSLVSSTKQLRRCGKKLPRYCDVNNDRRISIAEWLECLNTKRETTNPSPAPQRKGKNPLINYLQDD